MPNNSFVICRSPGFCLGYFRAGDDDKNICFIPSPVGLRPACGLLKTNPASSHVLLKAGMTLSGEEQESYSYLINRTDFKK